jgi:hypothetical protein
MSAAFPRRFLLLSTTLSLAAGGALLGLLPAAASPTVATAPTRTVVAAAAEAASPARPAAAAVAPVAAAAQQARVLPSDAPARAVEILREQTAAGLDCGLTAQSVPLCVHGEDQEPHGAAHVAGTSGAGGTATGGDIGCYGDGTSGARVRAVYARPQSAPDRYAASLPSVKSWAAGISNQFDTSAQRTGGRRHIRFATTPGAGCTLTVLNVVLPDAAFGSFRATIDALEARGFNTPSSKYLVWADATGYCGMGTTYSDDRPGLENLNNSHLPSYARIDRRCWGKVEAHELLHMLGGVQRSAPNSTAGFHCSDGLDVMCYDDGTAGGKQRAVCGSEGARILDCRNNDYFSTAAPKGSYLQTHWNTARSSFLSATLQEAAPAPSSPTTSSPSPAPAGSPKPASPKPSPSAGPVQLVVATVTKVLSSLPTPAPGQPVPALTDSAPAVVTPALSPVR